MNEIMPLIRKEMRYFANSAIAYVAGVFFLVITSVVFFSAQHFIARDQATLREYFAFMPFMLTLIVPALTMRSWAEEHRQGTLELLLTLPYSEWKLVAGKFLAPFLLVVLLFLLTVPVPLSVLPLGHFDIGVIVTEYLGMLLLSAASIAFGVWISSLTRNQVTAFLVTAACLFGLTMANQLASLSAVPGFVADLINYLSLSYHIDSFIKGLLDSRDIIYFLGLTFLFLFLNERSLVLRKWR
jgi:ABC-2 type transport system permease protein